MHCQCSAIASGEWGIRIRVEERSCRSGAPFFPSSPREDAGEARAETKERPLNQIWRVLLGGEALDEIEKKRQHYDNRCSCIHASHGSSWEGETFESWWSTGKRCGGSCAAVDCKRMTSRVERHQTVLPFHAHRPFYIVHLALFHRSTRTTTSRDYREAPTARSHLRQQGCAGRFLFCSSDTRVPRA